MRPGFEPLNLQPTTGLLRTKLGLVRRCSRGPEVIYKSMGYGIPKDLSHMRPSPSELRRGRGAGGAGARQLLSSWVVPRFDYIFTISFSVFYKPKGSLFFSVSRQTFSRGTVPPAPPSPSPPSSSPRLPAFGMPTELSWDYEGGEDDNMQARRRGKQLAHAGDIIVHDVVGEGILECFVGAQIKMRLGTGEIQRYHESSKEHVYVKENRSLGSYYRLLALSLAVCRLYH